MTTPKGATKDDELRMSAAEFDRIMGEALRVKPEKAKPQQKRRLKARKKPAVKK